jgi:hypothetical protein
MRIALQIFALAIVLTNFCNAQRITSTQITTAGNGWAGNSINTVVFRKNSLCSYKNVQYIAYYNNDGYVILGKRKLNSNNWQLQTTSFKGNIADAHNSISIITDGDGYLHMAWDHHNNQLHYVKSVVPGSLQMTDELPMTGSNEEAVSYPEFYTFPNGDLLFLYRDGASGKGNLVMNRYHTKEKKWIQLHHNLIDGEGKRNAYWQACIDEKGTIHISWVWRESPDVASNHDMCYAKSDDGGVSWKKSAGEKYVLPLNAVSAEYICRIPQNSELINQTSMCANESGNPFIASYWKEPGDSIPQYHVIYRTEDKWQVLNTGFRKTAFTLSGTGTKRIPISRPQIVSWKKDGKDCAALIFRDEEWGNKAVIALSNELQENKWRLQILTLSSVGSWEPTYDTELWKRKRKMNLFVQYTEQIDAEGRAAIKEQPVKVITFKIN